MPTCAPLPSIPLADGRRRFLRHVLCHAQVEFSLLESPAKVIDCALLTALGALGAVCGFSVWHDTANDPFQVVGRGLDTESMATIERSADRWVARCFETKDSAPSPLCGEVRVVLAPPWRPSLAGHAAPRILVGWRMTANRIGLMGIGAVLAGRPVSDREIEFLYQLAAHMLMAIRTIADGALIHGLKNELDQARQQIAESNAHSKALHLELEEAQFRLSGFNDIFHELSGLTESTAVMDAFLLVVLGIFSAQNGAILYADESTGQTHATVRGRRSGGPCERPAEIREALAAIWGARSGASDSDAQVVLLPPEQCKGLDPIVPQTQVAVSFHVDARASGVVCLGRRLVETQYGVREQELLSAFTHTFLAFLKSRRSLEIIQQLHADQQRKTIALEKTVQALSESRLTIASLEKTGARVKAALTRSLRRTTRASFMDILLMVLAGTVLGMVYNAASPAGISLVPRVWRYPSPVRIGVEETRARQAAGEILIVDARPTEFYNQRHIQDALNLPLALFDFVYMMRFSKLEPQHPIVVYGRTFSRHYDEELAFKLTQRGHPRVFVLAGGLRAWQANGLAVTP